MNDSNDIVIVGGGHAGIALCNALAAAGLGARVHLVCEEDELPYQRPPLSKAFLKSAQESVQLHRSAVWFADAGMTLHRADPAVDIDRARKLLRLRSGTGLPYRWLVLATGTRARRLPHLRIAEGTACDNAQDNALDNVFVLRNAADALRLRERLASIERLTVVGGGFIGLEVAATVRALGKAVQVLESAPRLLMRSLSPEVAVHVLQVHRAAGIDVRLGVAVGDFELEERRLAAIRVDAVRQPVDTLLLSIGAVPEHTLAGAAGLNCDNGIVVDEHMRSSDSAILAIGDCASFLEPTSARWLRLESVQNANDQARAAAATIMGKPQPYRALPWFWSEQGTLRLQMAGLTPVDATRHRRSGAAPTSFSILHYVGDRLVCVESVNAPLDHMAARKLLEGGVSPSPAAACDPQRPLKSLVPI